ncbi:MAG: G8 domain-containing protein [Pirellulales bacterium]
MAAPSAAASSVAVVGAAAAALIQPKLIGGAGASKAMVGGAQSAASEHGPIHASDPTAAFIQLQHDKIPNFVQQPTNSTVSSGDWSDPKIWSAARVPQYGDVVLIAAGTVVDYAAVSTASIKAIGVSPGATLRFSRDVDTRLTVGTLIVFEGGGLQIGQRTKSISAAVKAEVVFDGAWLDTIADPNQYGVGLLGFGEVTINGAPKSRTWLRLSSEPKAGDTYLDFGDKFTGWNAGETIFLPDTRQIPPHMVDEIAAGLEGLFRPRWEEATIDRVVGTRVYLTAPLAYDHLGARNERGEVEFLPHAAVLDRNVVFRSATPNGVRGHVLLGGRADVDVRYARFQQLGRTDAMRPLDNTKVDENANVTHVGTNQIGRYSVHLHHLVGPRNPANAGYQFQFVGNTLDDGRKWGLGVHGTSFGLIQDNISYKMQGSGFVTEAGSEIENLFYRNFAARIQGTNLESSDDILAGDTGRSGAGFWMRRSGNTLRENVVADASFAGVVINAGYSDDLPLPAFRGAIVSEPGESYVLDQNPSGTIENLEVYGRTRTGVWLASPNGGTDRSADMVLRWLRIWHTDGSAIEGYRLRGLTIADSVLLGSNTAIGITSRPDRETVGIKLHAYETSDIRIVDTRIANHFIGIQAPEASSSRIESGVVAAPTRIENVELTNFVNIEVPTLKLFQSLYVGKALEIVDVLFRPVDTSAMLYSPSEQFDIRMAYAPERSIASRDILSPDVVVVQNFNRVQGDDFRVYYLEQSPDFVPPAAPFGGGSPAPGMTNQQLWNQFGVALAGSVAPCETQRQGIVGYACPFSADTLILGATPRAAPRNPGPVAAGVDAVLRAAVTARIG